jgi:hypothetical protein
MRARRTILRQRLHRSALPSPRRNGIERLLRSGLGRLRF